MSVVSAAKAAVEESDVKLDSPAALMELHLRPAVLLLRKFLRGAACSRQRLPILRLMRRLLRNCGQLR